MYNAGVRAGKRFAARDGGGTHITPGTSGLGEPQSGLAAACRLEVRALDAASWGRGTASLPERLHCQPHNLARAFFPAAPRQFAVKLPNAPEYARQ
jgi:hypothetical protein